MMSLAFPAGRSLCFTRDLEKVAPRLGVPLEDKRFCVGPDTKLALWYGRRTQIDVNRGPYHSAEAALAAAAHKEIAYSKHFGQPPPPLRRERRPSYKFHKPPSAGVNVEIVLEEVDVVGHNRLVLGNEAPETCGEGFRSLAEAEGQACSKLRKL
ncbi:hypothetical protein BDN71DRAFT_1593804 [Pleurotus eryngii]|uniref:Uncharacterized protein n=1 Tax=Pleurotus eryngii TaxID=5323 RepID=A0A9P5ZKB0_PLEER|nr:hypothetical protein BDN71DRAFT_1593804 [Pleurotus eryngii]